VYVDTMLAEQRTNGATTVSAGQEGFPFLTFVAEVGSRFPEIVFFGRQAVSNDVVHALPGAASVAALPHYSRLSVKTAVTAATGTASAMWRHLTRVDHVWVFGPHPFGLLLVLLALVRRKRVTLGVRQDTLTYFASRLTSRGTRAAATMTGLRILNRLWIALSRVLDTTVVGSYVESSYGGPRERLFSMEISLIREADVISTPSMRNWSRLVEILTVGRLDPEKNPLLLLDAVAILEARSPGRYHLTWVGDGQLRDAMRDKASVLAVDRYLSLPGFVPVGPALLAYYRRAHVFVHVAVTEAFAQVLVEAQANGLPIIGTDVGGVHTVLDEGRAGILVPPGDAVALADAIEQLCASPDLRRRIVERGLTLAQQRTLERTAAAAADFLLEAGPSHDRHHRQASRPR